MNGPVGQTVICTIDMPYTLCSRSRLPPDYRPYTNRDMENNQAPTTVYEITNARTGVYLGGYEADSEDEALESYAKDAGYSSFDEAETVSGTPRKDLSLECVSVAGYEAE